MKFIIDELTIMNILKHNRWNSSFNLLIEKVQPAMSISNMVELTVKQEKINIYNILLDSCN